MQLLFNLTVPRSFACPTVLLVIHFINRGHVVYSTMKSLCYTRCTHSQEGNEIQRLQKSEMSTCFFPKFSPSRYRSFNLYLFVRHLGIWLPSAFCKMLDVFISPGKHRRKAIYVGSSGYFSPNLGIYGKTWYLSTIKISLILCHKGQILPLMSTY